MITSVLPYRPCRTGIVLEGKQMTQIGALTRSYAGLGAFIPLTWDFMV